MAKTVSPGRRFSRREGAAALSVRCGAAAHGRGKGRQAASSGPRGSAIISELGWGEIAHSLKLSGRELEIVRAVFDNRAEHTIGAELGISKHTVHTHMRRLFVKLGAKGRTDLAVRVMQEFLALVGTPGGHLSPICHYLQTGRCPFAKP